MFALSSVDVRFLVQEISFLLRDAFVDKVYQGKEERGDFLLKLRSPKTGKQQLYVRAPDALFLTSHRFSWPQQPSGFCMQLRKHLTSAKLARIEQVGFERIIRLMFEKGPKKWSLYLELFSKGNVVLVNDEGLIRGVMDLQRWKDRTLRVNAPYELPPTVTDTPSITFDGLKELYDGRELVKFCASSLSLGGKYAEELVARTGLDKLAKGVDDAVLKTLHMALQEFFAQPLSPVSVSDDAAPFPLQAWPDGKGVPSFSGAIESLVVEQKTAAIELVAESTVTSHKSKYQRIVEEQSKRLAGYETAAEENQRKGELVYERYADLKVLLDRIASVRKVGGWSAVKDLIKEEKLPIKVDERVATVTLDL